MSSGQNVSEHERVGLLVSEKRSLFAAVASEGYARQGRGVVFYCESWEETFPDATPFYMPESEPEFTRVGADIHRCVSVYRPLSEGVVAVVTRRDSVYIATFKLVSLAEEMAGSRRH